MGYRDESPPILEILPLHRAKILVNYTSAGQFNGQMTIGELPSES